MKLLTRMFLLVLTAFALVTAVSAKHSDTDIVYSVEGGNIYFDETTGTITDCDYAVRQNVIPAEINSVEVVSIGDSAFSSCGSLTNVEIPASVTSIGSNAFFTCSLTSVKIPNSVTSIGNGAFDGCWKLTSVKIPDSVASIENLAFYRCSSLTSVEIPSSVTSIGRSAFQWCSSLMSVKIPKGVISIGNSAFSSCSSLTSVEIPTSVTSIGNAAFSLCSDLTSVEIPSSVASIGDLAFYKCSSLTRVEIPSNVVSMGYGAFSCCTNLTDISVDSVNQQYVSADGILFNKGQNILMCYPAGKPGASYQIPVSVTSIGDSAFDGCINLTSIKIPANVALIEKEAFYNCANLISLEIPVELTSIGSRAFTGCGSLRDVYYGGSKEQWDAIDGINNSKLISDSITIHYNASMPDTPTAPTFKAKSAPTVGGRAISAADLSGLTEISVPVTASAESAVSVTICVPFFDGGKFLSMGFVTANVDKTTQSVTVPVTGNVSGAGKLNVIFLDADFRPLSVAGFDIPA